MNCIFFDCWGNVRNVWCLLAASNLSILIYRASLSVFHTNIRQLKKFHLPGKDDGEILHYHHQIHLHIIHRSLVCSNRVRGKPNYSMSSTVLRRWLVTAFHLSISCLEDPETPTQPFSSWTLSVPWPCGPLGPHGSRTVSQPPQL